ncbi:BRCT domain-containing protein [Sphingomonas sp. SUN019]|uniref:BRCT domain-containing protein n=1 Tax=Sphingomonas sp. SUN019 TaxID=2937788 RepID=UPI002164C9D8|nr:BRCT domain-containing protein [Sphingomonas sp. SUN019]UVO51544.1 BRCT domain-containing protein [Sphingomonas sp. SUN019]
MTEERFNLIGNDRITSRQIDELVGLARGVAADGTLNQAEIEFLQKWLAANMAISNQPMIARLYHRINAVLADGIADAEECRDLLDTLNSFSSRDFELGEVLKSTSLPLCDPAPTLDFSGRRYCLTGTFNFGQRADCEAAVTWRGGVCGSLTQKTNVLVIGMYATESWKHSSFGTKIVKAVDFREAGIPIAIVSEDHWARHLT